jgi:hypothetical protein
LVLMEKKANHPVKKYPTIGACGLDCGLCPSYHRDGASRCNGCCGEGFWDRARGCGLLSCCVKEHGLETCGECNEFEFCPRVIKLLERAKHSDTILSYEPIAANFAFVRRNGIKKWDEREKEKIAFLKTLLADYNDGRSKTFYCLSVQLLPLDKLKTALAQAQKKITAEMAPKDKAKVVREAVNGVAAKAGVELKLRNKPSR